jgi:hydrogenase small subunit
MKNYSVKDYPVKNFHAKDCLIKDHLINDRPKKDSCYSWSVKRGVSRRDFLKLCGAAAAMLGLEASAVPRIADALETNPRLPVIYLGMQECTCCSESFIRSAHPLASDLILDLLSIEYMEMLQAASGEQAEKAREEAIWKGNYLLIVEGSIPLAENGVCCTIGGKSTREVLEESAQNAIAVISFGNCATASCIQGSRPNPTQAEPVHRIIKANPLLRDKPVIMVPGCPPIAEVITGTIVHYLTFGTLPELKSDGRPKAFYDNTVHDTCERRHYFNRRQFVREFDDDGARQGWCLYMMGCRGPSTYNACASIGFNEGTSFPIRSGHPCLGCAENGFYDKGSFYTPLDGYRKRAGGQNNSGGGNGQGSNQGNGKGNGSDSGQSSGPNNSQGSGQGNDPNNGQGSKGQGNK